MHKIWMCYHGHCYNTSKIQCFNNCMHCTFWIYDVFIMTKNILETPKRTNNHIKAINTHIYFGPTSFKSSLLIGACKGIKRKKN